MSTTFGFETQQEAAQRMYNARASQYEDSWHPAYARRFVAEAPLRPGDRVLSLCCGTGLDAFLAAEVVGDQGAVVGVDVSAGMLAQLQARREREQEREQEQECTAVGHRIRTVQHDVTDLEGLGGLVDKGSFDAILCSCALVLLRDPGQVVAHWREYLKPGGIMVLDVPHEHNLRSNRVLEEVARQMGRQFPSNRSWVTSQESCKALLEAQGMRVDQMRVLDNISGHGRQWYDVHDAEGQYEWLVNRSLTQFTAADDFKTKAKPLFLDAWAKAAVDGKVEDSDALYLYVATRLG